MYRCVSGGDGREFDVKGKKAEIKAEGFMANSPKLYIDGKEVK